MKADGSIDRAGAMLALKPLQKADPQLYQKVLKLFVTCGMRGNFFGRKFVCNTGCCSKTVARPVRHGVRFGRMCEKRGRSCEFLDVLCLFLLIFFL